MDKKNWRIIIFLPLVLIIFILTNCMPTCAVKFIGISDKDTENLRKYLPEFRKRQLQSAALIIALFIISLVITSCSADISRITHYFEILSAMVLTHAGFGQLGWEIQTWPGDSIMEKVNKWWFRTVYSLGVFLLFVAILSNK